MFLEQVDIDVYGPHRKLSIGPLAPALNAVYGVPGAGKTAIVDFVRAVMLGGTRWHSHAAGRVVWCDNEGLWVCRREVDGTPHGRLSVERLSRDGRGIYEGRTAFARDQLPTEWLDTIVAPAGSAIEQAHRALAAAQRAGLDLFGRREIHPEAASVRRRYESLDRECAGELFPAENVASLEERRRLLRQQLERTPAEYDHRAFDRWVAEQRHAESEWEAAKRELDRCEIGRSDLVRSIAVLRDELAGLEVAPVNATPRCEISAQDRSQLEALDGRLVRWRRTLREVRDLRQQLEDRATDLRIDSQAVSGGHPELNNPRFPLHSVEQRVQDTRRRLEWLAERSNREFETSPHEAARLADVLRHAHDELNQVCESLSHREAIDQARRHADQLGQLARCEQELLASIDALINDRGVLLRRFAEQYHIPAEQFSKAFGEWCHCDDHPHLYQWLLSDSCPPRPNENEAYWSRRHRLEQELAELDAELLRSDDRIETARHGERHWAAEVDRLARHRPTIQDDRASREVIQRELNEIDSRLHRTRRLEELRRERDALAIKLRSLEAGYITGGRFCQIVGQWLQRMTQGRLREFTVAHTDSMHAESIEARVDARHLREHSEIDQANIALAIRLAAAASLHYRGRPLPLVLDHLPAETARRLVHYHPQGCQWILLTDQQAVVDVVASTGGKVTRLHTEPVRREVPVARIRPAYHAGYDVNRELDTAWREANGLYDSAPNEWQGYNVDSAAYDLPVTRRYRYDAPHAYPALHVPHAYAVQPTYAVQPIVQQSAEEPAFFLTEDSSVDQAPSVDAVVAARLRGLGITTVGQLLAAEPALLAERLALSGVAAREVRQWQDEARLVCRVRRLRAFDARVLVGCGVTDAKHLAAMHPTQLLERVQAFLATDRGRHILSSGSSYELSRITNWIVSANNTGSSRTPRTRQVDQPEVDFRGLNSPNGHSLYEDLTAPRPSLESEAWRREEMTRRREGRDELRRQRRERMRNRRDVDGSERRDRPVRPMSHPMVNTTPAAAPIKPRVERDEDAPRARGERKEKKVKRVKESTSELQFYLNRHEDVEAAPTIGHRLAEQLHAIGVRTVDDLLNGNPASIAEKLALPRVTSETVLSWQRQATMVCRIPQLRGHDAQLLVAAGITEPQQLAKANAAQLYDSIRSVARTAEGKRYLRNSPAPDLKEVSEWISWAQHSRPLAAA